MGSPKKWILPAAAAAILTAAGGVWLTVSPRGAHPAAAPKVTVAPAAVVPAHKIFSPAELAGLQGQATEACKCARATTDKEGKKACWSEIERVRAAYPGGQAMSPCGDLSPQYACFGDGPDNCVITQYSNDPEISFCTPEEAREVEAAVIQAYNAGKRDDLAIMKRFEQAYRDGRKPLPRHGEVGCTG